jgi:glyoxylase-like metal-dependent hydrolase (beta-lactamase superfamily II)
VKLHSIHTGNFKLDGGAMFGVVPKSIWQRTNPPDENNMCSWAMRSLLVESGNRLILIDTGMGNKQDEKFFSYYYLHGNQSLDKSLAAAGFNRDDITDVFLTHLHFDHCGGAIQRNKAGDAFEPAFKNAVYWSNEAHWHWAVNPNPREKASFLKENILPIQESGQLKFVEMNGDFSTEIIPGFKALAVNGHTEAQLLPYINYKGKNIIYCADLVPSTSHIPLPYIMGYDVRPLLTMQEKESVLTEAAANGSLLFFEHDYYSEICSLQQTDRGVRLHEKGALADFI